MAAGMGTFEGHVVPGGALLLGGIWWMANILIRYHKTLLNNERYTSSASFSCSCWSCKHFPWEGVVKIVLPVCGIILEVSESGVVVIGTLTTHSLQHITMYTFFMAPGIIDILLHFKVSLPPDIDYISTSLAFIVEFFVFKFHLQGRTGVDTTLHVLLGYAIMVGAISTALEIKYRRSVLLSLSRAVSTIVQGTWFLQIAFVLYDPRPRPIHWEETDENVQRVVVYFAWHVGFVLIAVLIVGMVVKCVVKTCSTRLTDVEKGARKSLISDRDDTYHD